MRINHNKWPHEEVSKGPAWPVVTLYTFRLQMDAEVPGVPAPASLVVISRFLGLVSKAERPCRTPEGLRGADIVHSPPPPWILLTGSDFRSRQNKRSYWG